MEFPARTIAVVGSHNYSQLDAVRAVVGDLDGSLLLGDRGIVAETARAAARNGCREAKRIALSTDDIVEGVPRWHSRNRRLVLHADAIVVFADKPREHLWHATSMFSRAGLPSTMYGPDGNVWEPPRSAADPRPDARPFYIKPNCSYCGTPLVLQDELENSEDVWHDEWMCPVHRRGCYMDWPSWSRRAMREMFDACEEHASGEAEDEGRFINAEDMPAFGRKLDRIKKRAKEAVATAKPRVALKAVNAWIAMSPEAFEPFELLATLHERNGDLVGARRALLAAIDRFLVDSVGNPPDFQRMLGNLRRLEAVNKASTGGGRGNRV